MQIVCLMLDCVTFESTAPGVIVESGYRPGGPAFVGAPDADVIGSDCVSRDVGGRAGAIVATADGLGTATVPLAPAAAAAEIALVTLGGAGELGSAADPHEVSARAKAERLTHRAKVRTNLIDRSW